MKIDTLMKIVEEQSGVVFSGISDTGVIPLDGVSKERSGMTVGDSLLETLFVSYVEHKGGELTPQSFECIMSELEYVTTIGKQIAVKLIEEGDKDVESNRT